MCVGVATGEQAPMECRLVSVPNPKVFAERRREDERAREHQSPTHPSIHRQLSPHFLPSSSHYPSSSTLSTNKVCLAVDSLHR